MTANVGGIDRTLRIVVGIVLIALFFLLEGPARYVGLLGLVALFTGLVSFTRKVSLGSTTVSLTMVGKRLVDVSPGGRPMVPDIVL